MMPTSWKQATGGAVAVAVSQTHQPGLSPRARAMFDQMTVAANIEPSLDSRHLVKGWLDRGAMSVVYGPTNIGKTFFALDVAYHVAAGKQWHGSRVDGGPVIYIVGEGGKGFLNRVVALQEREGVPLWCLPVSVDLCRSNTDAKALLELLAHLKPLHGEYALIIVDTLARAMGGGDENASQDMGALVQNIDLMRQVTGAHVTLIHHTGKDQARGARGHSSLRAATDTEIELSREGKAIHAEARKQRDMACGEMFAYTLLEVELGRDQDGDLVTTCVVEPCDPVKKKPNLGPVQHQILDALRDYVADHGQKNPGGTGWPEPGTVSVVDADAFLSFVSDQMTNDNPKDRRKTAKRGVDGLVTKSFVAINGGKIWLV